MFVLAGAAERLRAVTAMLAVLGLAADDPAWGAAGDTDRLHPVVEALVGDALERRARARADRDFATADAIRTTLTDVGVQIDDTPAGARWSLTGAEGTR